MGEREHRKLDKHSHAVNLGSHYPRTRARRHRSESCRGRLVSATTVIWTEVAKRLASDWSVARQLTPSQWEEWLRELSRTTDLTK
jgi:hypothetical protein